MPLTLRRQIKKTVYQNFHGILGENPALKKT